MKKKLLTLLATVVVGAVAFVGCGDKAPETPAEDPVLYWQGDHCPVTKKKWSTIPEDMDGELGETILEFEHEGKKDEANVWNEDALAEFEKNKDKYIADIQADSK